MYRKKDDSGKTGLKFLYLDNWNYTYNTKRNQISRDKLYPNLGALRAGISEDVTKYDKERKRYPLRELFIPVSLIKEGIDNKSYSVLGLIRHIIDGINKGSQDIFDIQIGSNKYAASEVGFIDRNYVGLNNKTLMENLFEFRPNSPNSIVSSYLPILNNLFFLKLYKNSLLF